MSSNDDYELVPVDSAPAPKQSAAPAEDDEYQLVPVEPNSSGPSSPVSKKGGFHPLEALRNTAEGMAIHSIPGMGPASDIADIYHALSGDTKDYQDTRHSAVKNAESFMPVAGNYSGFNKEDEAQMQAHPVMRGLSDAAGVGGAAAAATPLFGAAEAAAGPSFLMRSLASGGTGAGLNMADTEAQTNGQASGKDLARSGGLGFLLGGTGPTVSKLLGPEIPTNRWGLSAEDYLKQPVSPKVVDSRGNPLLGSTFKQAIEEVERQQVAGGLTGPANDNLVANYIRGMRPGSPTNSTARMAAAQRNSQQDVLDALAKFKPEYQSAKNSELVHKIVTRGIGATAGAVGTGIASHVIPGMGALGEWPEILGLLLGGSEQAQPLTEQLMHKLSPYIDPLVKKYAHNSTIPGAAGAALTEAGQNYDRRMTKNNQ